MYARRTYHRRIASGRAGSAFALPIDSFGALLACGSKLLSTRRRFVNANVYAHALAIKWVRHHVLRAKESRLNIFGLRESSIGATTRDTHAEAISIKIGPRFNYWSMFTFKFTTLSKRGYIRCRRRASVR